MIAEPKQGGGARRAAAQPFDANERATLQGRHGGARTYPLPEHMRLKSAPVVQGRRRPMANRGGRVSRTVQHWTWRSPETFAVMVAAVAAGLLCFQVSLWARVTAEDFELSRIKREMQNAKAQEDGLRAEISNLVLPGPVAERAHKLNLTDAPGANEPDAQVLAPTDAALQPIYGAAEGGESSPVSVKD